MSIRLDNKTKNIIDAILNLVMFILVIYSVSSFFIKTGSGNMAVNGTQCFKFFTIDSNVLGAIMSALIIPFNTLIVIGKMDRIPKWASVCKLVGTTAVTVTFLTVVFFLGPTQGFGMMFSGNNLFLHLICPLLSIISYTFFEQSKTLASWKASFFSVLPTLIYGIVYLIMVVVIGETKGGWVDFYGFNMGGMWYVSIVLMLIITFGISIGLWGINKAVCKKKCNANTEANE